MCEKGCCVKKIKSKENYSKELISLKFEYELSYFLRKTLNFYCQDFLFVQDISLRISLTFIFFSSHFISSDVNLPDAHSFHENIWKYSSKNNPTPSSNNRADHEPVSLTEQRILNVVFKIENFSCKTWLILS